MNTCYVHCLLRYFQGAVNSSSNLQVQLERIVKLRCNLEKVSLGLIKRSISQSIKQSVGRSVSQSVIQSINPNHRAILELWSTKSVLRYKTFSVHLNSCLSGLSSGAVHGGWSDFGDWSECSAKCDGGIMTRRRTCTNPPPSNGGACCVGDNLEAKSCNTNSCAGNILGARLSYNTHNADFEFLLS